MADGVDHGDLPPAPATDADLPTPECPDDTGPHVVRRAARRRWSTRSGRRARPRGGLRPSSAAAVAEDLPGGGRHERGDRAADGRQAPPTSSPARRRGRRRARPSPSWPSATSSATDVEITARVADGERGASGRRSCWRSPARSGRCSPPSAPRSTSRRHLSGVATATAALGRRHRRHRRPRAATPARRSRAAGAAEVRRAVRRRRQPPVQPVGRGAGQGQPRRGGRRGGRGLPRGARRASRACRSRSR